MGRSWVRNNGSAISKEPFRYIETIVSVTIGDSITEIPDVAFYGCSNISSLTIPENVKKIGSSAFDSPQKTIFLAGTPPAGYSNAKGKVNYVPNDQYGSGSSYKVYPMLNSMFEVDGITYVPTSLSERTCDVIDCVYDSQKSTAEIGETVSYKNVSLKVMDINPYTFYKNTNMRSVSLNNQGSIGDYALSECSSLSDMEFGDNITSIGEYAFKNCSSLTNFTLPAATQTIGKGLFSGCSALQSLSVDANNSIYDSRDNCNAIVEKATNKIVAACNYTVIPNSVASIGSYAFMGCHELSAISIPSSVTSLGSYAFMGCQGLSTISVPQSVTSVGDYAFDDCTKLANVIIEDRTEALALGSNGSSALFSDCPLDSVYIGGKITYNNVSSTNSE